MPYDRDETERTITALTNQVSALQAQIDTARIEYKARERRMRANADRLHHQALFFEQQAQDYRERIVVLEHRIATLQGGRSIAKEVARERARVRAEARDLAARERRLRRRDIATRIGMGGGRPADETWYSGTVPVETVYRWISGIGFGAHRKRTNRKR